MLYKFFTLTLLQSKILEKSCKIKPTKYKIKMEWETNQLLYNLKCVRGFQRAQIRNEAEIEERDGVETERDIEHHYRERRGTRERDGWNERELRCEGRTNELEENFF